MALNKLIRLSPTGIEYGDYAWNFASGCGNNTEGYCNSGCFPCWAYQITKRFPDHYPNGFKPTIYPEALLSPLYLKKPSRILCAFMGDLFWSCPGFDPNRKIHSILPSGVASISMSLKGWIYTTIRQCPQHTFLFKTKCPQNLPAWSPFPDNCLIGATITDRDSADKTQKYMLKVADQNKTFVSIEPFLGHIPWELILGYDRVIIGAQTKPTVYPKIEWIQEILVACHNANIPVFMKDNLQPLLDKSIGWQGWKLRQESPK